MAAGPTLYCNLCRKGFDVYEYVKTPSSDHFRSSRLAQAFSEWTGDENVPMNFTVVDVEGIFPKTIAGQSLSRVRKSLRLLKTLNAPFVDTPTRLETNRLPETETFLVDFLNIIYEHPNTESSNARMVLDGLIRAMHDLLSSKDMADPFECYFNDLVPYVQQCLPDWQRLAVDDSHPNLAAQLLVHFQTSAAVRKTFGKFSIPFDVIHVMVSCFACSVDMEMVGNWVLDFMGRICRGDFFWKRHLESPFVQTMNHVLKREITPKKLRQRELYDVVKNMRLGDSSEHYSTFLKPFHEVQMLLRKYFRVNDESVKEMAFVQTFPAVCFQDHGDQLGFTMAYNFIVQTINSNNGVVPKGTFKTAKQIHKKVQKFVHKIKDFETANMPWTIHTFQLFLTSDPDYEREISETLGMLFTRGNDEQ